MNKHAGIIFGICLLALSHSPQAGIAYGTINNFDVVNDTGVPCHGFEIELDDIHSQDITYTYDWNHYGTPKITEDNSDPLHPKVFVRYASAKTTNGAWAAFTAVPSGPIAPTQGHQFTNPSVNFGGEHFGVGYRAAPTATRYNWLIDNGSGVLILGPAVNVATPTFVYVPPAAGPAQVQAAIVPPPPPAPPPLEFGPASWVKEIRTTTHNNNEVKLRDLISPDPENPDENDWRNGEPDEVEVEWQILQTDYNSANGGANGELKGAPEELQNGDEVITRRYEFYAYVGPLDPETGEAKGDRVGPDGIHGTGNYTNTIVVGDFLGAQMSAFDVDIPLGLIDHLADGVIDVPYTRRTVIIAGTTSFVAQTTGALPDGMSFDPANGEISGTPAVSGVFAFTVQATVSNSPPVSKNYTLTIAGDGADLPPRSTVTTSVSPANSGSATGTGTYTNGASATVVATPGAGYSFAKWTDNGLLVSREASYQFSVEVNRSLVANFVPAVNAPRLALPERQANTLILSWPTNTSGFVLQHNSGLGATNWTSVTNGLTVVGGNYQATIPMTNKTGFFRLTHP